MPTATSKPAAAKQRQKLFAQSVERYNGGASTKLQFGSATVTVFLVGVVGSPANTWKKLVGYGVTPGARKTYALEAWRLVESAGVPTVGKTYVDDLRRLLK